MALWVIDRRNAEINHRDALLRLEGLEDYEMLSEREQLNRYVEFALEDGNPIPIPIQPRRFSRSVAQQSVLTVTPFIGVGRPAYLWVRERLATKVCIRERWKTEIVAACQSMGISRHRLFRDLDSFGTYLAQSFIDKVWIEDA